MQEYSHSVGIERVARQPIATYGFLEFAYVLFIHTTLAICGFIQILWICASDVAYNKANVRLSVSLGHFDFDHDSLRKPPGSSLI